MGGRGSLRGDGAWGKGERAGGLEQRGWGLERAEGLGWGGAGPSGDRTDGRSFVRTEGRLDGWKFPPLFYRTLSP